MIAELHGILQDSRARGTNASAIRAVELMGKRLNLWQGRAAPAGGSPDEDHPPLTDIVP